MTLADVNASNVSVQVTAADFLLVREEMPSSFARDELSGRACNVTAGSIYDVEVSKGVWDLGSLVCRV